MFRLVGLLVLGSWKYYVVCVLTMLMAANMQLSRCGVGAVSSNALQKPLHSLNINELKGFNIQ